MQVDDAEVFAGLHWAGRPLLLADAWDVGSAAAVSVPVSADIDAGYGDSPGAVWAAVRAVVQAGAAGVNLEDRRDGALLFGAAGVADRGCRSFADPAVPGLVLLHCYPRQYRSYQDSLLISGAPRLSSGAPPGRTEDLLAAAKTG